MIELLRSEEPRLDYLFPFTWPIPTRPVQRLSVFASPSFSTIRWSTMHLTCQLQQLSPNGKGREKEKEKRGHSAERRRKVDHWVPAIWIPSSWWSNFWVASTETSLPFIWKMYLTILCVLLWRVSSINYTFSSSSNFGFLSTDHFLFQKFFISNSNAKQDSSLSSSTKPEKACDASYDTVSLSFILFQLR